MITKKFYPSPKPAWNRKPALEHNAASPSQKIWDKSNKSKSLAQKPFMSTNVPKVTKTTKVVYSQIDIENNRSVCRIQQTFDLQVWVSPVTTSEKPSQPRRMGLRKYLKLILLCALSPVLWSTWSLVYYYASLLSFEKLEIFEISHEFSYSGRDRKMYEKTSEKNE